MPDKYVTFRQYAVLKKVSLPKVYSLISDGSIIPEEVAGKQLIVWEDYKDYDTSVRRNKTSLLEIVTDLQQEVNKMKKIVYRKGFAASK